MDDGVVPELDISEDFCIEKRMSGRRRGQHVDVSVG